MIGSTGRGRLHHFISGVTVLSDHIACAGFFETFVIDPIHLHYGGFSVFPGLQFIDTADRIWKLLEHPASGNDHDIAICSLKYGLEIFVV